MSKRVHLLHDDKYVDEFIENMNKLSLKGEDVFVVVTYNTTLKFVKSNRISVVTPHKYKSVSDFIETTQSCDYIYLHSITLEKIAITEKIKLKEKTKIIWVFWGGDGYSLNKIKTTFLYKRKTKKKLQQKGLLLKKDLFFYIKKITKSVLSIKVHSEKDFSSFLDKIDYCATWVYADYQLIRKKYNQFRANFMEFAYVSPIQLTNYTESQFTNKFTSSYIITGNSANPSNNHLEIFDYLKKSSWTGNIICPLSYSQIGDYNKVVIHKGKSLFGDRFIPLLEYIDKAEYATIIKNAEFIIVNQLRQQAGANLIMALKFEVPIVALANNTLIQTFKSWGIDIAQNIDNLDKINTKLNKSIVEDKMSEENIANMYKNLCFQ